MTASVPPTYTRLHSPPDSPLRDSSPTEVLLDSVTGIFNALRLGTGTGSLIEPWRKSVRDIIEQEHLAYRVDEGCLVHSLVDRQFDADRAAELATLAGERYRAALKYFEEANADIQARPPRTRHAVRSCFECAENLF